MRFNQLLVLSILLVLIGLFFSFDLHHQLTLENLKSQQLAIENYRQAHPVLAIVAYAMLYIAVTGLSLPGATVLSLAGGAMFGLLPGLLIVSFASSIGATLAFLAARFLLRDWVKSRLSARLQVINEGVNRDGGFYLFSLRLVPLFPFFLINLAMGLTPIKTSTFYWVSQIGMLPGTLAYVNAGTQLAKITTISDILSPALLGSFVLLAVFPWLAKQVLAWLQHRKVYAHWIKPVRFDTNLVVIGAGAGGLVSAYIAAALKAKVTLIEKQQMGGDCLHRGCVPSKALIRSAKLLSRIATAQALGIAKAEVEFEFAAVMERVKQVIKTIEPHDSIKRYTDLGVEVIQGTARIVSPWTVEVSTTEGIKTLTTRSIVIAAGARPFVPAIPGLDRLDFLTSDNVWDLRERPQRLLVLGGGPIGCELAQTFQRLGSQITLVEMASRIMLREDPDVSALLLARFLAEGVDVRVNHIAKQFIAENGENFLLAEHAGQLVRIGFDKVLIAIGRAANLQGYGIDELGIALSPRLTIESNAFQQTNYPNIFAVGDVTGLYQFTHAAAHQAGYATVNALFGQFKKFRYDYSAMPWATFTDPEVARVGLNEQDAQAQNIAYEVSTYDLADLDRAIMDNEAYGFVKVLTMPGKDRILGVTIVGEHAGDLIAEFVLAMQHGIGLNKILSTIHIYPTWAEANKYAAGVWKRNHTPKRLLEWLERFHAWQRG